MERSWDAQKKHNVIVVLPPPPPPPRSGWVPAHSNAQEHGVGDGLVGYLWTNEHIPEPRFLEMEVGAWRGSKQQLQFTSWGWEQPRQWDKRSRDEALKVLTPNSPS